jgi:hypothetical protein
MVEGTTPYGCILHSGRSGSATFLGRLRICMNDQALSLPAQAMNRDMVEEIPPESTLELPLWKKIPPVIPPGDSISWKNFPSACCCAGQWWRNFPPGGTAGICLAPVSAVAGRAFLDGGRISPRGSASAVRRYCGRKSPLRNRSVMWKKFPLR